MKKILFGLLFCVGALFANNVIKVGATPAPYGQILTEVDEIKQYLKERGYELEVMIFNDYIVPNMALEDKEIDANIFQHEPFLINFNENKGTHGVKYKRWVVSPLGIYSKKFKSLEDKKSLIGADVSLPNDPTNESRALDLLALAGLIKVDTTNELKTPLDIKENPYNLNFIELEAAQLPRTLDEVGLAVIPGNFALGAKLDVKNALFLEDKDLKYANIIIAVRKGEENEEKFKILWEALTIKPVKDYIQKEFKGVIIPRF